MTERNPTHCPKCNTRLVVRSGSRGQFLACPKSYKGNNHGTWTYRPAADADPCASNLSYPSRQQEREDFERDRPDLNPLEQRSCINGMPRGADGLRRLCREVAQSVADPDLAFLRATDGVAAQLRSIQGGPDPGVDVFLDPNGYVDYAIASQLHDSMYLEDADDPLAPVFNVGMPLF